MNGEFVGVAYYVVDPAHDPIELASEASSSRDSGMGSYHPSLECFMADMESDREQTPEGYVQDSSDNEVTPSADIRDEAGDHTPTPEFDLEDPLELCMS